MAPMLSRTRSVTANSAANVARARGSNRSSGRARPEPVERGLSSAPSVRRPASSARLILPLAVFGSESANSTIRGYL